MRQDCYIDSGIETQYFITVVYLLVPQESFDSIFDETKYNAEVQKGWYNV